MKIIEIKTNKGTFEIMLDLVAENYAFYKTMDINNTEERNKIYRNELNKIKNNNELILEWLINYTEWNDWEDVSFITNNLKTNNDYFWENIDNFKIKKDLI
jgi:hypothetical protein